MNKRAENAAWIRQWKPQLLPSAQAAQAWSFQERLAASELMASAEIEKLAARQVSFLIQHARSHVPHYQQFPNVTLTNHEWLQAPILTRKDLQENLKKMRAATLPQGHNELATLRSSGSTGMPIEVVTTNISQAWQKALTLRAARWAGRDFSATMAIIRKLPKDSAPPPLGAHAQKWGDDLVFPIQTGKSFELDAVTSSTDEQRFWLEARKPDYLMTYPSLLRELALSALIKPMNWRPRGISTLGEVVDDELRETINDLWGLKINDVYSAQECGVIAIECAFGNYHVQQEVVHVELLDEKDKPCGPGDIGRVVVTNFTNFATPLIRYELGDQAILGGFCGCGCTLPVLERILGRERNLMVTAQGKFWPSFGTRRFRDLAPLNAQQFIQTSLDHIEVRYVAANSLSPDQIQDLTKFIQKSLPTPMKLTFVHVQALSRGVSGKFELFMNAIKA